MAGDPVGWLKSRLAAAIDWRFRDRLEAEREATVELGKTFIRQAAVVADENEQIRRQLADLEARLARLEERNP